MFNEHPQYENYIDYWIYCMKGYLSEEACHYLDCTLQSTFEYDIVCVCGERDRYRERERERNALFNDALNTFYLR